MPRSCVDVGVVTWNSAELTVDALRRTLDSETGVIESVLVHDNASTDGTPERISDAVPEADVEVSVGNLGFAAGVNRLIERSSAPWLLLLNSDAWPEPGAISAMVEAGVAQRRVAAVAPRLLSPEGELEESTHPFPSVRVALLSAAGLRRTVQWSHDEARPVDWAVGAALLLRRDAIDDVGPFDERYFMYAEDLDWCWRARRRGWDIWLEPSAVVRHIGNASGATRFGAERDSIAIRNSVRFYRGAHGRVGTATWRTLNAAGSARLAAAARLRRDPAAYAHWMRYTRAYLGSGSVRDQV